MTILNAKAAECLEFRKAGNFKENTIPSYYSGKQFVCYVSEWQPTKDIAQAWMLVEKCHELGYHVEIKYWDDMLECGVYGEWNLRLGWCTAKDIVAITAACVEALSK